MDYTYKIMVNWDVIDNVFFDMDGTLLDLHFDNHFWLEHLPLRYAQIHGKSADAVREHLMSEYRKMRGTLEWYCLEYWQEALEVDIVALKKELMEKIQLRPNAIELLEELGRAGKHVALVSNAHPWSISLKMESVLSPRFFDAIHSSHNFGYPKEQQQFWSLLQQEFEFDPQRTLFIDDNEQVLDSADRFGITHLLSIRYPDMQAQPQNPGKYVQIENFEQLI